MKITPIKTRKIIPPKDDIKSVIKESITEIPEKSILVVTSKVVSIWQGRCLKKYEVEDKDALMAIESEKYIARGKVSGWPTFRTIKYGILGSASGIDESNANGFVILLPEKPHATAEYLWKWIRKEYKVKDVGILFTDSRPLPLRRGSIGVSLGFFGFEPIKDYRNKKDIFGNNLRVSQSNLADGLAAATVVTMGEGRETTPFALIEGSPVEFTDKHFLPREKFASFYVKEENDIFYPYIKDMPWEEGKGKKIDL